MSATAFASPVFHETVEKRKPRPSGYREVSASGVGVKQDLQRKMRAAIEAILQMGTIGENWDGEGGAAPLPELIDSAISLVQSPEFIDRLPFPSRIVPVNDGRIALDFYVGKAYLSARIDAPGQARVMVIEPGSSPKFVSWQWAPSVQKLGWF